MTGTFRILPLTALHFGCLIAIVANGQDWRAAATQDIDRMYESLSHNHPGAVDHENPNFRSRLESIYKAASERAKAVKDSAGYFYAVRSFAIHFQDEHLKVNFVKLPDRTFKWPGFAVTTNEKGQVVVFRRDDRSAPPVGAQLISCDGKTVDELIEERIIPFIGNWALPSKRAGDAPFLLIDSQNPFVDSPEMGTFAVDGKMVNYRLQWQELPNETRVEIFDEIEPSVQSKTAFRILQNGTVWISIASFQVSNPQIEKAIGDLTKRIQENRDVLANAPALVIDLRGNNGGSSQPGVSVASAIWGKDFVDRFRPRFRQIEWRASKENLAALSKVLPSVGKAIGKDSRLYKEIESVKQGMQHAIANKKDFHEAAMTYPEIKDSESFNVPSRIYFLTDTSCVSAALDFADLVLNIPGVAHIGLETAGDTKYLDTRNEMLPSNLAQFTFPSSIHRGRERQDNQSYKPVHRWNGNIADTTGLEKWVEELTNSKEH